MNEKQYLEEYQFSNAGQYRAIMQSLGYQTEYNKGCILFTRDKEQFRIRMDEIKSHVSTGKDAKESLERICKYFDKERNSDPGHIDELSKKGISIVNWGNIMSDDKDRFTIIDHELKICHTGKELYEYALQNRYLLDGKGSKMEEHTMSHLISHNGKQGKVRYTENGISIFYKKEKLEIPDSIFGKKLSEKQKQDLLDGKRIAFKYKKGNIYLEIDRELNSIIVLSEKELHIPQEIGGYKLTDADKYLLANGYSLDNKLLHSKEGYFLADISFTTDRYGITFGNVQMVPDQKAQEMQKKQEQNYIIRVSTPMQVSTAISMLESNGINAQLVKEELSTALSQSAGTLYFMISGNTVTDWEPVIHEKEYNIPIKDIEELPAGVISEKAGVAVSIEAADLKDQSVVDSLILSALKSGNYSQLDQLSQKGCKPSSDLMQQLNSSFPDNSVIAVKKIFKLESNRPSMPGEIKASPSVSRKSEMVRPISQTVNRVFSDL